jgi:hypothetical protein
MVGHCRLSPAVAVALQVRFLGCWRAGDWSDIEGASGATVSSMAEGGTRCHRSHGPSTRLEERAAAWEVEEERGM